jgi:hypothetical protein
MAFISSEVIFQASPPILTRVVLKFSEILITISGQEFRPNILCAVYTRFAATSLEWMYVQNLFPLPKIYPDCVKLSYPWNLNISIDFVV